MSLIEIDTLSFSYEKDLILEKISLKIVSGEFLSIFGPNGGGKTTFLKLIMGFLKPTKGEVRVHSKEIGYVPQVARFDKEFPISVLEIVLMGFLSKSTWWGKYPAKAKEKAYEAIAKVGLKGREQQAFGTLSGGQAQRVLIARALVSNPELLILDEPTANVDPEAEELIYQLLKELKKRLTILLVTHDMQGALRMADRLLCIQRSAIFYTAQEMCSHFALGLYHPKGD
jgi:zinc transport system ATP-binding protein